MQTHNKLFSLVNTDDFKSVLYTIYTGNQPTSTKRVEQVFTSVENLIYYLIHILTNTKENHFKFIHSLVLQTLFTSHKYKSVISTLKYFDVLEVHLNLDGKETYVPKSAEKIFGKRAHPKAYRTTEEWFSDLKDVDQFIYVELTEKERIRIKKAFEATKKVDENQQTLDYLQECMNLVETTATEDDIDQYIDIEDDFEEIITSRYIMENAINGERKAGTGKKYYNRINTNLGGCPREFRKTFISNNGENMVGIDGSNFQPFILMNIFIDAKDGEIDSSEEILSEIIANGKFYTHIIDLIEDQFGVSYSKDQVKEPVLKMINRNHSKNIQYLNDEICEKVEAVIKNEYPVFYNFLVELNKTETLFEVYGYTVAKSIINQGKSNTSTSYIYADYETAFMVEVLRRVQRRYGIFALYTAYDCLYVPESMKMKVYYTMMEVSKEFHYTIANFAFEGDESVAVEASNEAYEISEEEINRQIEAFKKKQSEPKPVEEPVEDDPFAGIGKIKKFADIEGYQDIEDTEDDSELTVDEMIEREYQRQQKEDEKLLPAINKALADFMNRKEQGLVGELTL